MYESGICYKCAGGKWIIIGMLILLNEVLLGINWWIFFGILLILKGILCMGMPTCGHVSTAPKAGKSKK